MKVFGKILRNVKLQTKIVISQLIISGIVFALMVIAFQINQIILKKIFLDSSIRMLSKQELSQLNNIQYLKQRLEFTFQNTITSLDQLNSMQNITQFSGFYDEEPQRCLNEDFEIDSYSKGNTICYGIFNYSANSTNQQNIQQIKNSISLLTQFYQLTSLTDSQLAVVLTDELQFFSLVKFVKLPQPFYPQQLAWYKYHMSQKDQNQTYTYGLPFRASLGDIKLRITSDLNSKEAEGVISREIDISPIFNKENDVTCYLYNLEGDVIFANQYKEINSSFLFNLYNESITGFNYDDWLQIKNYSLGLTFESNCVNFNKDLNILCRYNSFYQVETYIQVQSIKNAPYLIILYQNNTEFINLEQKVREQIQINFNSVQYSFIIITLASALFLAVCSNAGIVIVLKQTITAIKIMRFNSQNIQKQIFSRLLQYNLTMFKVKSTTGTKFSDALKNLIIQTKSRKKSEQCIKLENKKYQKISFQYKKFSEYIFKLYIQQLSNYYNNTQQNSKEMIKKSLFELYRSQKTGQRKN